MNPTNTQEFNDNDSESAENGLVNYAAARIEWLNQLNVLRNQNKTNNSPNTQSGPANPFTNPGSGGIQKEAVTPESPKTPTAEVAKGKKEIIRNNTVPFTKKVRPVVKGYSKVDPSGEARKNMDQITTKSVIAALLKQGPNEAQKVLNTELKY